MDFLLLIVTDPNFVWGEGNIHLGCTFIISLKYHNNPRGTYQLFLRKFKDQRK